MPVRMIVDQKELLECEKIQSVAFVYSLDTAAFEKELEKNTAPAQPCIGFFNEENVLTACMELPEYQIQYDGNWVKMVGVGGVSSLPEYRFGGAVRQLFESAFKKMREDGAVFSSLYPFSHAYYRQFGYETCQLSVEYQLPVQALCDFRYHGRVRMILPDESIEGLKKVFYAHYSRYNMAIHREERHWKKILGKDPYRERVYTYLLEDENGPNAYIVLAAENSNSDEKIARVRELAFVHPKDFSNVLGFLYRLSAQYKTLYLHLPDDIPLASILHESYDLQIRYHNQQMARVIHVSKALELKPHFDGSCYTVKVHDQQIPENNGVFQVQCQNKNVSVKRLPSDLPADLELNVQTLTQLLMGFLNLDEAIYKKDVQVYGNLKTLQQVFTKHSVFLTDHF